MARRRGICGAAMLRSLGERLATTVMSGSVTFASTIIDWHLLPRHVYSRTTEGRLGIEKAIRSRRATRCEKNNARDRPKSSYSVPPQERAGAEPSGVGV